MDYSVIGPGFGEEEESPFAHQQGNPPPTRSNLASPIFGDDDENINPRTQHYQPYSPTTEDAPQNSGFAGMDDDNGFRSPGLHSSRIEQQESSFNQQHQQHQPDDRREEEDERPDYREPEQEEPTAPQAQHQHQQQPQEQQYQQPQQRQVPQYRLQCKITALERTGRKDPILKFDVHVRLLSSL